MLNVYMLKNKQTKFKRRLIFTLPDVSDLIYSYQRQCEINPKFFWTQLNVDDLKKIFKLAMKDFFERRIDEKAFCAICNDLLFNGKIWWLADVEDRDRDLGKNLYDGAELAYHHYLKEKGESYNRYKEMIKNLYQYFQSKNK